MSSSGDEMDIGRMLGWAGRPLATPGRYEELSRVVSRYRDDSDFADSVNRVFAGAGLDLHVDDRDGIVVTARQHSMLRLTVTDVTKSAQNQHRAVTGAVILAVARAAYPESSMVDDPHRVAVFTTQSVVDALDRAAQAHAGRIDRGQRSRRAARRGVATVVGPGHGPAERAAPQHG